MKHLGWCYKCLRRINYFLSIESGILAGSRCFFAYIISNEEFEVDPKPRRSRIDVDH